MRAKYLFVVALATVPLAGQNLVQNGDFSNGLNGWTQTGYSYNPAHETWDTTGMGPSPCFGCNPGGQVTPPPYPPNTLETNVPVPAGVPLEFSADLSTVKLVHTSDNADGGTIWVEVNNVEVARHAFGSYTYPKVYKARLTGRFVAASGGMVPLKIYFSRAYLGNINTPRVNIDNVSLQIAIGPTFAIRGNRELGKSVSFEVAGAPSSPFAVFAAAQVLSSGVTIPGIAGAWWLNPTLTVLVLPGTTDAAGLFRLLFTLPPDPYLTQAPVWFQPAQVVSGQGRLGFHQGVVCFQ
jgi:hypothetical protein